MRYRRARADSEAGRGAETGGSVSSSSAASPSRGRRGAAPAAALSQRGGGVASSSSSGAPSAPLPASGASAASRSAGSSGLWRDSSPESASSAAEREDEARREEAHHGGGGGGAGTGAGEGANSTTSSSSSSSAAAAGGGASSSAPGGDAAVLLLEQPAGKRWRDWWLRLAMTLVMIGGCFAFVYLTKQPGVVLLIFVLQGFIYKELVKIAVNDQQERALPGFHGLYWYWFLVATFFMYVKTTQPYLLSALRGVSVDDVNVQVSGQQPQQPQQADAGADAGVGGDGAAAAGGPVVYGGLFGPLLGALDFLVSRYEAVAYALYILGFMAFVIALKRRRNFRYQFSQFAYCHMALLFVVVQSTYLAANVFNGLIWFFVPCGLVVCNDSFAYVAGFFFGRTPLIRLSPKKTVEGFVGGAIATVVFALLSTRLYTTLDFADTKYLMACPVVSGMGWSVNRCDVDQQAGGLYAVHPLSQWRVGRLFPELLRDSLSVSEMQLHAVSFAVFASVVAPFGGFFASGFKRAFRIKDFGTSIPGHGGFTDRMDCQLIMGLFSYIYATTFLSLGRGPGGTDVVSHYLAVLVARLGEQDLRALHARLGEFLEELASKGAAAAVGAAGAGR